MRYIDKTNNVIAIHESDASILMDILEEQQELDTSELENSLATGRTIILMIEKK